MVELLTDVRDAPPALRPVSPAEHLAGAFAAAEVTGPRAVQLREVAFLTQVGIRVVPGTPATDRFAAHLGTSLPTRCGTVASGSHGAVLWLAPDEFLVIANEESADDSAELTGALQDVLADGPGSVVDLSANRTTFELHGASALAVLQKGCPLDLHPRHFAVGTAYVTGLGSVPILLWKTGEQTYRILPRSSFADHVGRWLVDAMLEFAAPELKRRS